MVVMMEEVDGHGEDEEQRPVRLSSLENQRQSDLLQVGLHAALQLAKQVLDGNHERNG